MFDRIDKKRLSIYLQVILLALAASVIYSAPYLRQLFKTSLLDAFSLTEAQLGNLSTMYAITSIICYIPGGWIADRVAPRILVIIALFASAATYAWWATIPSYEELLIIHGLWGVIGVGVLWAAMFKHIRLLAGGDEQGRMFGTLEGARGLFEAILLTVATFVFGLFATRQLGMINVIIIYTVFAGGLGVIMLFMKGATGRQDDTVSEKIHLADLLLILKQPTIWLLCVILTAVYHIFWATIEFPSFAETGGFAMPLAAATALGATKLWMRPFGGVFAGMLGDRIGNMCRSWRGCSWPASSAASTWRSYRRRRTMIMDALGLSSFPFGLLAYGLRGVFWALLYQCPGATACARHGDRLHFDHGLQLGRLYPAGQRIPANELRNRHRLSIVLCLRRCRSGRRPRRVVAARPHNEYAGQSRWSDVTDVRLCHRRRRLGRLRPCQSIDRRPGYHGAPARSRRFRSQHFHTHADGVVHPDEHVAVQLGLRKRAGTLSRRPANGLPARSRARRLVVDQRHGLRARPSARLRRVAGKWRRRLVLRDLPALFPKGRKLATRRRRLSRRRRPVGYVQWQQDAESALQGVHRSGQGSRVPDHRRLQRLPAGRLRPDAHDRQRWRALFGSARLSFAGLSWTGQT